MLKYLKKYRLECFLAPLFKMLEAIFELIVPLIVKDIINNGIANKDSWYIIYRFIILLALGIVGFIAAVVAQYFSAKAATGFAKETRHALFDHIESLSFTELDSVGTSTLITRMTSDINQMQTGVNMFLRLFLRSPFVVFGALIMAFIVDTKMALIFAVVIPVLFLIVFLIMYKTIPLFKKLQAKLDSLTRKTRENIKGVRVIRAFNEEDNEIKSFEESNKDLTKFQIFTNKISSLMNPLTYAIINIGIVLIIYIGSREVNEGLLLKGEIVAEYNYMSQILVELIKLANLIITLTKAIACSKRVNAIFELKPSQEFPSSSKKKKENSPAIEFNNVSMKYKGNSKESLKGITFVLKKGETLGIIGGTGSGKSTLINLIPRYYDITEGSIRLFGNDIKDYSKADIRKMVGVVSQKTVLYTGTIRDNLVMSDPENISDEEINSAVNIAQASDVIKNKEKGLDEEVLSNGSNFSGGQKQRLSIARTLLQKPDILVLDDSSSALDYLTDKNLRHAINNMDNKTTTIITSQRTSSIMESDLILVLDEGKIAGIGKHRDLLKNCSVYKEIYDSQIEEDVK